MVTLDDVLAYAATIGADERWQIWQSCGEHDQSTLCSVAGASGSSQRYCPDCTTAWTASGRALKSLGRTAFDKVNACRATNRSVICGLQSVSRRWDDTFDADQSTD